MSEVGIAFGADGRLWTLGRREDGDETGFGSNGRVAVRTTTHVGSAERERLNRYDSPHLFRHGDEIYVIARRDIGVPYDLARHVSRFEHRVQTWEGWCSKSAHLCSARAAR